MTTTQAVVDRLMGLADEAIEDAEQAMRERCARGSGQRVYDQQKVESRTALRAALEELARQAAEAAKSERRAIEFGDIVHRHVLVMQAAVIDASRGRDGLAWIRNTLFGPGHYPDVEAAREMGGAQAYFDAKVAEHEAFRAAHPAPVAPAALAVQPVVPAGWRVVPVEPTPQMIIAAWGGVDEDDADPADPGTKAAWARMLAASPAVQEPPPAPIIDAVWTGKMTPQQARAALATPPTQPAAQAEAKDAARYRWLRDKADYLRVPEGSPQVCLTDEFGCIVNLMPDAYPRGEALDTAIDAAMTPAKREK